MNCEKHKLVRNRVKCISSSTTFERSSKTPQKLRGMSVTHKKTLNCNNTHSLTKTPHFNDVIKNVHNP